MITGKAFTIVHAIITVLLLVWLADVRLDITELRMQNAGTADSLDDLSDVATCAELYGPKLRQIYAPSCAERKRAEQHLFGW